LDSGKKDKDKEKKLEVEVKEWKGRVVEVEATRRI